MNKNIIIAVDGYSSCGKSTLAKALAMQLGFIYVDSGAMYRAVTLYFLRNQIDFTDPLQVSSALENIHLNFQTVENETRILLNNEDVSEEIRKMPVTKLVSAVAALREVRLSMVKQQQRMGKSKNIIMDGRDIGTTVFPDATLKLFMTAELKVRAERRYLELKSKGEDVSLESILENINQRDYQDTTRTESPLIKSKDAILLDNTNLDQQQQLQFVLNKLSAIS
jgi:cytidylate kinase